VFGRSEARASYEIGVKQLYVTYVHIRVKNHNNNSVVFIFIFMQAI